MRGLLGTGSIRKSLASAVVAVGVLAGVTLPGATSVEAAPRSSSTVIAQQADRALQALDRWDATGNPTHYVRFVRDRDLAARLVAIDLQIDPSALRAAWVEVDTTKQHALLAAVSQLGVPYRSLASEEGVGFDCSGLTIFAFEQAGVDIPRVSRDQIRSADEVSHETAEAGDLVYYPGHVGIYLGADTMVHSPNSGNLVEVTHLPSKSLRFGDALG